MFAATQLALVSQPGRFLFQLVITQWLKEKKKITDEGIEDIVDLVLTLLGGGKIGYAVILAFLRPRHLG